MTKQIHYCQKHKCYVHVIILPNRITYLHQSYNRDGNFLYAQNQGGGEGKRRGNDTANLSANFLDCSTHFLKCLTLLKLYTQVQKSTHNGPVPPIPKLFLLKMVFLF